MKVNIIGCGIIGNILLEDMSKAKIDKIIGTEVNPETANKLRDKGYEISDKVVKGCDVYIISVLTTDQVLNVVENIDCSDDPLVVIESTIIPGTVEKIKHIKKLIQLVIFPHRFYDKDPTKRVFNLNRVMGAVNKKFLNRALKFYGRYMDLKLIHLTDIKTAEVCKPIENTMRFIEIAVAEMFRMDLAEGGYDFEKVRAAVNTKWNIEMKEAKEGIGGHCLPKDTLMINNLLPGNFIINAAMKEDMIYKEMAKKWKKKR